LWRSWLSETGTTGRCMLEPAWSAVQRLLVVRLDNLGDVLVTTPAVHALRAALPAARITALVSPVGAQVARLNADIDEVWTYQAPWMDPWHELTHDSAREQALIAKLRAGSFDAAVIFSSFRQSPLPTAYLCYLADIPLRLAASIDGPGSLLTTRHKHPERMLHEVERGLDLVSAIGVPPAGLDLVLTLPPMARPAPLPETGLRIVLHPGCSMPARTYPWTHFAEVAERLVTRLGATVALTGVAAERELCARIADSLPATARSGVRVLAGELSFEAFCATIRAADLTITNNTGPMHIAAALRRPVVALFALTNPPEQWGPWRTPYRQLFHDVPCRICYSRVCPYTHDCLRLVTPDEVLHAVRELLHESGDTATKPTAEVAA
jgi:ADP-heptose:LPS heptosyltransferase